MVRVLATRLPGSPPGLHRTGRARHRGGPGVQLGEPGLEFAELLIALGRLDALRRRHHSADGVDRDLLHHAVNRGGQDLPLLPALAASAVVVPVTVAVLWAVAVAVPGVSSVKVTVTVSRPDDA